MHFIVATAIVTAGYCISDTNKVYLIFVRDTRSGQVLEENIWTSTKDKPFYNIFDFLLRC